MTTRNRVEKYELNNQIVSMRKDVKRARLWLINNLNHRVKKLNKAKTNEREVEKNQSKILKLRSEIQLLKHIDIDEVSKFALCNKQEPLKQLTNENEADAAQKVMLQLANHKFVQEQVQKFRQIYAVPVDRLILLIRSLGLQYQKKKMKSMLATTVEQNPHKELENKKVLGQKKKVSERLKIVHSPKVEKSSIAECQYHYSAEDDSKLMSNPVIQVKSENDMDNSSSSAETSVLAERTGHGHSSQPSASSGQCLIDAHHSLDTLQSGKICTTNPSVKKQINRKENLHQKIPWPKLSAPQINKTTGTMIIKQLNLDNEADIISVEESHKMPEKSCDTSEPPRDSFFVGGVDLPLEENDEMKNGSIHLNSSRVHVRKNLGKKAMESKTSCKVSRNTRELINGPIQEKQTNIIPSVSTTEVLHPSWQAKRKEKELQINIGECKGKKIRFDND